LEGDDEGDEKAITAMGILNTLETLLTVFDDDDEDDDEAKKRKAHRLATGAPSVVEELEPIVLRVVNHVLVNGVSEFYEEALQIACDLTTSKVSTFALALLYTVSCLTDQSGHVETIRARV